MPMVEKTFIVLLNNEVFNSDEYEIETGEKGLLLRERMVRKDAVKEVAIPRTAIARVTTWRSKD